MICHQVNCFDDLDRVKMDCVKYCRANDRKAYKIDNRTFCTRFIYTVIEWWRSVQQYIYIIITSSWNRPTFPVTLISTQRCRILCYAIGGDELFSFCDWWSFKWNTLSPQKWQRKMKLLSKHWSVIKSIIIDDRLL